MPLRLFLILAFLGGCKSAEEIQRSQMIDQMSIQLLDNQKLVADLTQRISQIEERLGIITGQVEETAHLSKQVVNENLTTIKEQVTQLKNDLDSKEKVIAQQDQQLKQQGKFIKNLTKTISTAKKNQDPYNNAMYLYGKGKYSQAKPILLDLSEDKSVKGKRKARVYHNIGMIEWMNANYQNAAIYFSKIYAEYPSSAYNKRGLLFLGKSFQKLGKNDEAKGAWEELIKKFPKSKQAREAKKLLK